MTPADQARNQAISLEAKKDALAQRQNGDWRVSFTVQGIDMDPRLTQAAMGTRYAMVLVEIGDDELPVPAKEKRATAPAPPPKPAGAKRDHMDWRDVQPAAQAGIRCNDATFCAFLSEVYARDASDLQHAEQAVRDICGVESRTEFGTNHKARMLWHQLDTEYQAWLHLERV